MLDRDTRSPEKVRFAKPTLEAQNVKPAPGKARAKLLAMKKAALVVAR